jgi:SAM-dependent methyltransferase
MDDFYDRLAPLYDLIFLDWDASMDQQAGQLAAIIGERWGAEVRTILDVASGIGTQSIGLARKPFEVTASDLSVGAIDRARVEARRRGVEMDFLVCDMRVAKDHHGRQFDLVIACDNAIPHLLSDEEILVAFQQMFACTRPGGGCLVTVRDYDREERGTGLVKPYGVRDRDGKRYVIFQVWDFAGEIYDLAMYFVVDDGGWEPETHVMRSKLGVWRSRHTPNSRCSWAAGRDEATCEYSGWIRIAGSTPGLREFANRRAGRLCLSVRGRRSV